MVELILAGKKVGGLSALECQRVPYSWLLRFRTQYWYLEGLGASPAYRSRHEDDTDAIERLIG